MAFSDTVRESLRAKRARQVDPSRSTRKDASAPDLGSGSRGVMPTRGESITEFVQRRRRELTHTETVRVPGAWR